MSNHDVDQKCICMFLMFPLSLPAFFLLARFGRKTDGHIVFGHMFFKFSVYFLPIDKV